MATAEEAVPRDTGDALGEAEVSAVTASTTGWDANQSFSLDHFPGPGDPMAWDACLPADPFPRSCTRCVFSPLPSAVWDSVAQNVSLPTDSFPNTAGDP